MIDIHNSVPYANASPRKTQTISEFLKLCCVVLINIAYVLFLSVGDLFRWIQSWFNSSKNITGQLALVTGGANGLGREIALCLAKRGCNVAVADVDEIGAERTSKDLTKLKVKAKHYICDISDYDQVQKMIDRIESDLGPIDILINNAGLLMMNPFRKIPNHNDISKVFGVNVFSSFWTIRVLIDKMIARRRGHIVSISSLLAHHTIPGGTIYCSTKAAISHFMDGLAEEIQEEGYGSFIKFSTAFPYFIQTRKDMVESVELRFPALRPEYTAGKVVEGIINNQERICVPNYLSMLDKLAAFFPHKTNMRTRKEVFAIKAKWN